MTNEMLSKLLNLKKKVKTDTIWAPYGTPILGPKLRSWQCSVAFVISPSARGLAGQRLSEFHMFNLQAGNLGLHQRIGYPIFPSLKIKLGSIQAPYALH